MTPLYKDTDSLANKSYDKAGNMVYDGVFKYSYDAWNRLVKATKAYRESGDSVEGMGENGENDVILDDLTAALPYVSFAYDGLGRRINPDLHIGMRLGSTASATYGNLDATR